MIRTACGVIDLEPAHRLSVCVIAPPLVAAGLCALLRTLPEVVEAEIATSTGEETTNRARGGGRRRGSRPKRLLLLVGKDQNPSLPYPLPMGDWVCIQSMDFPSVGVAPEGEKTTEHLPLQRGRGHAILGLQDSVAMLRSALHSAACGQSYSSPKLTTPTAGLLGLSARQQEVAQLAAEGLSNGEIAQRLFVDITTVKTHLTEVYRRIGIRRRSQIIGQIKSNRPELAQISV